MIRNFDGLADTVQRAWHYYGARPYDVDENAPDTIPKLIACAGERLGRIRIWPGGTESAIYADPKVNWMFRAWHDNCHLVTKMGFDIPGEIQLGEWQRSIACRFGDLFAEIVHCEIAGQAEFYAATGRFLADQKAFTLDYLNHANWHANLERY